MAATRQRGFSMLEVLISIVIAVFGLLGLVGIQAVTHVAELESYQRAQALVLMNDIVERINANRASAGCYAVTTNTGNGTPYLGTSTGGGHLGTPNCTTGFLNDQTRLLANGDLSDWDQALQGAAEKTASASVGAMNGARGCVSFDAATNTYTVAVAWQGMTDTFLPVVNCGNGLYGPETRRRVVWTTLKIATLG